MQIKVLGLSTLALFIASFSLWQIYTDGGLESLIASTFIVVLVFAFLGFVVGVIYGGKFLWDEIMERINK